ncbi:MAG: phosphate signaling complex protein PhoU [Thermoanaerobaculia bacterium]|nr:phosphate signaling complex protein PhoU [Thermoanaerobaculia bacterium]
MKHLDQELASVRQMLLEMAGRVEEMIADAGRALAERDSVLAGRVQRADRRVDTLEKSLDESCLSILALRDPKAVDFRFLIAVQKIVGDLERMGDCAVNIAQAVQKINEEPKLEGDLDLPRLLDMVRSMVRKSLDALVRRSPELAREVCQSDDQVDHLYHHLFRQLVGFMQERSDKVTRSLQLLLVSRNLERIADHATNIAEDVIYYLEAKDVRHPAAESEGS